MQPNETSLNITTQLIKERGLYSISRRRNFTKNLVAVVLFLLTLTILTPLFSIMYSILSNGLPVVLNHFPDFFVTPTNDPTYAIPKAGAQNAIWGTVILIITTTTMSLPIGIPAGIYLANMKEGPYTSLVRLIADVLQSTPTIILGFVMYIFWVIPRGTSGYGWIAGGLALSFLMIPIVTRVTEEGIRTVPNSIYEAAASLGLPEWRIMLSITIRSASSVILTGIMLAIARIAGETAPVIMTMLDSNVFGGFNTATPTLTYKIFLYQFTFPNWTAIAWGMALVLIGMIFLISVTTRTDILSRLWKHLTLKLIMIEFSVVLVIQTLLSLSSNFAVFLLIALFSKYLIYDVLQKEEILEKILENIIGKIVILFVIIESIIELLLFIIGTYSISIFPIIDNLIAFINSYYLKYGYLFNFRLSEFLIIALSLYYSYRYYQRGLSDLDLVRILIAISVGILLIRLTFFNVFMQFFNIIFVMFLFGIGLQFLFIELLRKTKWVTNISLRYLSIFVAIEAIIESLLYFAGILGNYIYQINFRLSEVLIVVIGVIAFYHYFVRTSEDNSSKNYLSLIQNVLNLSLGIIIFFLFFISNDIITYVFVSTLIATFCVWYIFVQGEYFSSFLNTNPGRIVIFLAFLEIIIQGILMIENKFTNYVYQINNRLFYVLATFIIVFILLKYFYNMKNNLERIQSIFIGILFICILQFVYPGFFVTIFLLKYSLFEVIYGQFVLGLLLKIGILYILLANNMYKNIWQNLAVRILLVLGAIETIFEAVVILLNLSTNAALPIIMIINGILIYFIIFYFLLLFVFKIDIISKLFIRDASYYG